MASSDLASVIPAVPPGAAGSDLRARVEALGSSLATGIGIVIDGLPGRPTGPQRVGEALGQTTVTASRLLKALGQEDPIAVVQLLPGPNPLRKIIQAASEIGVPEEDCRSALKAIAAFDELIRVEAGDRSALKAMLSAWLPGERREFEAQRRQAIFKAHSELEGISCDLEVNTIILHPSEEDSNLLDIVNAKALLGIDRIRPEATVRLSTKRLSSQPKQTGADDDVDAERPRIPLNLDGEPALDGLHTVRLDEFCNAPPAPLVAREFGGMVEYALGPTGFGRGSKVDLVIGEVNRAELVRSGPGAARRPYFFSIPEMATRKVVLDVLVPVDFHGGADPELVTYQTSALGPAVPGDPARALDIRTSPSALSILGTGTSKLRLLEFARYGALLDRVFHSLGRSAEEYRVYRVAIAYPLMGSQITLVFPPAS